MRRRKLFLLPAERDWGRRGAPPPCRPPPLSPYQNPADFATSLCPSCSGRRRIVLSLSCSCPCPCCRCPCCPCPCSCPCRCPSWSFAEPSSLPVSGLGL